MAAPRPDWLVPADTAQVAAARPAWLTPAEAPSANEVNSAARQEVAGTAAAPPVVPVPTAESAARGAFQGLSMGWGDEASAAVAATLPFMDRRAVAPSLSDLGKGMPGDTWGERYQRARDFYRRLNSNAESGNPGTYMGGSLVGAVAPAVITAGASSVPTAAVATGAKGLALAAGQGAAQGAGYSSAPTGLGVASDTALGAGLGLAGYGVGKAVSTGAGAVRAKVQQAVAAARQKTADAAEKEVAKGIASEVGTLGSLAQDANRQHEWLIRLLDEEKSGALDPAKRALLESLRKSPEFSATVNKLAERVGEKLPVAAGKVAQQEAVVAGLQAAAPAAIAEETAKRLAPEAAKKRAWGITKRELSPVIGAYLGNEAADALGGKDSVAAKGFGLIAGGVAGAQYGRGRFGKSLTDLKNMPSTQVMIQRFLSGAVSVPEKLAPYIPQLANASLRGGSALGVTHYLLYNNDEQYRRAMDEQAQPGAQRTDPQQ